MTLNRRSVALLTAVAMTVAGCAAGASGNLDTVPETPTTTVGRQTTVAGQTPTSTLPQVSTDPVYGGTLRYGIEADSLTPWTPQGTAAAVSGHMVMRSVYDTLALPTRDLEVEGNLLASITPNSDWTVWTLETRPGIEFHDGSSLTGAVVADNLQRHRRSFVTGPFLTNVADISQDDMTVTVTMRQPWVTFPSVLTTQVGYVASSTWLAAVDTDPSLALTPVGTGPFVFDSYEPGGTFRAVRNDSYWREGLPYLDAVEFTPLRNIRDRSQALLDNRVDIIHTSNGDEIARFRERIGEFSMVEAAEFGETTYIMLNAGNPTSPVSDSRVRSAMAMALDYELIKQGRNGGIFDVANGPFSPGMIGYLEDTGFPTYDPDGARALVDAWEADNGPLSITFTTTSDEFNRISAELYAQFWEEVGIDVTVQTIDQSLYIGYALTGNFEAYFWRLHSGFDPDLQNVWWNSLNAIDYGTVTVNFSRLRDPVIDEALAVIRTSADDAARRTAAEDVNRRFADQAYNLWLGWAITGIISQPDVRDVNTGFATPAGSPVLPTGVGIGGSHQLAQIWLEPGS
ncbi:MAG: ABC transporter substrate-binding protein [Acidimicrobiia bacterium]|nr:ABC transporter substrate-binding protein [Acidimicrobiia bacterium]